MKRLALYALILGMVAAMALPMVSFADQHNPCNPCAKKNPCNPCAKNFMVKDDRNVLTFESKAPLEKIIGTTSKIMGHVQVNPKDVTKGLKAMFELDLASLKTGIALRDEHMRDNFLETAKYPKAVLTVDKITWASKNELADMKTIKVNAQGTLELHGEKRPIELQDVSVTYFKETEATKAKMEGDLVHIDGNFSISLPDYNIKVPQMIVLKLDKTIKINVDVFGTTKMAMGNPCNPCNPCAKKNPCNPCNPCAKKAANPCNPCAKKAKKNPCNPCNPCKKGKK